MNFSLLNKLVEKSKLNKYQIAEKAGISRTTLDNALNGADIKVSTIEKLSNVLGVLPAIFFDEPSAGVTVSGHHNQVNASGATGNINADESVDSAVLRERVSALQKLLAEKERTIRILMERK